MANKLATAETTLSPDDVVLRAVQFFSNQSWRATSQSARSVTFQGRPRIPWFMILLTVLGFVLCVLPGVILYFFVIQKMYRFVNLVVTATPTPTGSEVSISYPGFAAGIVSRFIKAMPGAAETAPAEAEANAKEA